MTPLAYEFEPTEPPPWEHQRRDFLRFADAPIFALFYEQRCGKTRPALDVAAYRHERGDLDSLLVLAWPNGVHRNWGTEEAPRWLPRRVSRRIVVWRSGRSGTKDFKGRFADLLRTKGLAILTVNAEAITTEECKRHLRAFLATRNGTMLVVDECDWASSPAAERTKTLIRIASSRMIRVKALLGGTPATESPFQLFSQFEVLRPGFFGFRNHVTFRHHFGEYPTEPAVQQEPLVLGGVVQRFKNGRTRMIDKVRVDPATGERRTFPILNADGTPRMRVKKASNFATGNEFEVLSKDENGNPKYRNLDELHAKMAPVVSRVLRSDVSDAPAPTFSRHFYQASKEQRRVYEALREEFRAELRSGYIVEAKHVLTRWLRLQQVLSNRLPSREEGFACEECEGEGCVACDEVGIVVRTVPEERVDPDEDPRLDALRFILRDRPPKTLVWCRFEYEVTAIVEAVTEMGGRPVRFDGQVPEEERMANLHGRFRRGDADVLVGNGAAGQRGLPMDCADLAVYYSSYFSGRLREQLEARTEALFKRVGTSHVDIACEGTIDEKIVAVLRTKRSLRAAIMRDRLEEWL